MTGKIFAVAFIMLTMLFSSGLVLAATHTVTGLGTLGGTTSTSRAIAVNDEGRVVGESATAGDRYPHAFSWTQKDGMIDLGTLGGTTSRAIAVNDEGQVVGESATDGDRYPHAFLWTRKDGMIDLGTLGGTTSRAIAVNDEGQVVGESATDGDRYPHAFSWTKKDGMIDLGTLGGTTKPMGGDRINRGVTR